GSAGRTPRRRPRRARESGRAVAPAGPGYPFYPYHPPRLPVNSRARPGPGANRATNSNSEVTLARKASKSARGNDASAPLGYEAQLWKMAVALRGSLDAAEYKHVVLGLIFLKYISDAFEETRARLEAERDQGADPEDPDEYRALNVFW